MKILVLSDSHAGLSFMRRCIEAVKPNAIIHLGDHFDDGEAMKEEYPGIRFYLVPGNCDRYRAPVGAHEILILPVCGVDMYMTHGHRQWVKQGIGALVAEARRYNAQIALYGHTHRMDCHQETDGLWVFNPGSAGYNGGSAGILKTDGEKITACYFVTQEDLEEMK